MQEQAGCAHFSVSAISHLPERRCSSYPRFLPPAGLLSRASLSSYRWVLLSGRSAPGSVPIFEGARSDWRASCIGRVDEFEEEECMKRFFAATVVALGCSVAFAHAQDTKTTTVTKVDGKAPQTVTYTGCVQTGTETKSFILNHVAPMSRSTTTTGTTGSTTTTTTTYTLVPDQKIELETHVGHKVEVTGMMIPAGESKVTTTTKVDRENAPDSKTTETVKSNNAYPQFRVLEVKNLAESCD
jgi:hypothetical protein